VSRKRHPHPVLTPPLEWNNCTGNEPTRPPHHAVRAPIGPAQFAQFRVLVVHRVEPVRSGSTNFHGTLYGGTLMRWIENAASLSARAFTDGAMIVAGVHGLVLLAAGEPHVFLHTHAMAVRADKSSVTIRVEVSSEDPLSGASEQSLHGYFTYRPLDRRLEVPARLRERQ
jgi:acyl-CoA hydrolase